MKYNLSLHDSKYGKVEVVYDDEYKIYTANLSGDGAFSSIKAHGSTFTEALENHVEALEATFKMEAEVFEEEPTNKVNETILADRKNAGKLPMHLVPPDAIKAMAAVLDYGMNKYAERNWEKGAYYSVPYASLMRHLLAFWNGENIDPESGLPHTFHILMNAAMMVRYFEEFPELDDRPVDKK